MILNATVSLAPEFSAILFSENLFFKLKVAEKLLSGRKKYCCGLTREIPNIWDDSRGDSFSLDHDSNTIWSGNITFSVYFMFNSL